MRNRQFWQSATRRVAQVADGQITKAGRMETGRTGLYREKSGRAILAAAYSSAAAAASLTLYFLLSSAHTHTKPPPQRPQIQDSRSFKGPALLI